MGSYKTEERTGTFEEVMSCSEIESLREEMEEWSNNMDGTALENTQKYEDVSTCADTLECASDLEEALSKLLEICGVDNTKEFKYQVTVNKNKRRGPSRAVRLGNELTAIRQGVDAAEERAQEITDAIEEVKEHIDELEGVDFPGMF